LEALDLEAIQHSAVALAAFGIADLPERLSRAHLLSNDAPALLSY
jgi:hypothetical protein